MTAELSRVLKHELTHSFVGQKTHGHAPTWLQEGLAQWMEGKRSGDNAAALVQIYDAKQGASLGQLEGSWMRFPGIHGYGVCVAVATSKPHPEPSSWPSDAPCFAS